MPQSAIDADIVDYILAPENIPSQLLRIRNSYVVNNGYVEEEENIAISEEGVLQKIINIIYLKSGNDFHHYKQSTIRRRIARRMVILQKETLLDYYNFLRNGKQEQDLLFNDLLIPVTYFFRDDKFFESLTTTVFPKLIENAANNSIRIWVAGCSTGEEAFSIAILLHEYLLKVGKIDIKVQLFASDISEKCIAKARSAIYSAQDIQLITEARLQNYFIKKDGNFYINKVIRDMCVFAVHNFIKDPPFAKIDLVSCRNVLIYLDSYLQNRVMETFHYALKDKGFLFLGKSESAANVPNLFETVSKHEKIYSRKFTPKHHSLETLKPSNGEKLEQIVSVERNSLPEKDFRKIACDILFSKYTPVGVIINENHEIVYFHGDISPFLLPSPEKATHNILKMAREGISAELRDAILQIKENKGNIHKEDIIVANQEYRASFEIVPLNNSDNHIMILFYKKELPDLNLSNKTQIESSDQQQIQDLEAELSQLHGNIKRVTEEHHIAFEELKTTNEELLSSSEELQVLNEEVETTTEELQSNNEELVCINDELLDRQEQLIALQNYSESIIKTIHEPLIVINTDFIVKSANPAFYRFFNSTEIETEGQNFFEIGDCHWNVAELRQQLSEILTAGNPVKDFEVEINCSSIGKKIIKINAQHITDTKPGGLILIAIEDITDLVSVNKLLVQKNEQLQKNNNQLEDFSSAASHDLQDPLRKIHMFCNRIIENDKDLSDTTKHDLERIKFSLNNMGQLINDLIGYSRINTLEKDFKKTDLNTLLNKTLRDLNDDISEKSSIINVSPLPVLKVIPFQIQQLFSNLVLNSIKYTNDSTIPEITIISEEPTQEEITAINGVTKEKYVKIKISDNGIGFVQDYADKIFQPFYRLHSKNKYKGSGLGLALVKKIINNHNGFIKAESKINEGAQFSIYLPKT
jgi:two-component system CheB/CheR fusion protein